MKKVLSVALASAMVLGMGANAFAIEYSTGSNETASWPKGFAFEGDLFVTDKDGDIIKDSTTTINTKKAVDFQPGDVIWMPLYADNQKVYGVTGGNTEVQAEVAATTVTLPAVLSDNEVEGKVAIDKQGNVTSPFTYWDHANKVVYYTGAIAPATPDASWRTAKVTEAYTTVNGVKSSDVTKGAMVDVYKQVKVKATIGADLTVTTIKIHDTELNDTGVLLETGDIHDGASITSGLATLKLSDVLADIQAQVKAADVNASDKEFITSGKYKVATVAQDVLKDGVQVVVKLPKVAGKTESAGTIGNANDEADKQAFAQTVAHGHYTGNIDKNWSINLIEKEGKASDLIENAELYKADAADVTSYGKYTKEIKANAVYLKVTLKDEWKTIDEETLKYYVYIANNKTNEKTNQVWVSGTYAAPYRTVDFTWSNNANKAGLWKAEENGTAVFDFADKAFFTVKMYKGETMYLDLKTAYDKAIAGEMDVEADSFYKFDNNANFSRTGELVIVTDDDTLVPYEIDEDGNFVELDAEFVKDYKIAHTNAKVNGFKFDTKQLGNYVLSTEELGAGEEEVPEEDEEPADNEPAEVETPEVDEEPAPETNKPNPETGAEDFVGLAVSLAVVSVAAAGALALKK